MNVGLTARRKYLLAALTAVVALSTGNAGPAGATLLLAASPGGGSADGGGRGMAGLVGWIVGGALLGGAIGYGAHTVVQLPLSLAGAVGLGVALGGGLGGITHLLSTDDPAAADDESVTVDMANQSTAEPRPADLFDDHPDPVLFVTDAGGGPVVLAANDAYAAAFDLPATAIEDAPLDDVLRLADDTESIADRLGEGNPVDDVLAFETPDGDRRYRVRSVAATDHGYILFTPVES